MDEREMDAARREATHDIAAHPDRSPRHEDAINRYLSGVAYQVLRSDTKAHPGTDTPEGSDSGSDVRNAPREGVRTADE